MLYSLIRPSYRRSVQGLKTSILKPSVQSLAVPMRHQRIDPANRQTGRPRASRASHRLSQTPLCVVSPSVLGRTPASWQLDPIGNQPVALRSRRVCLTLGGSSPICVGLVADKFLPHAQRQSRTLLGRRWGLEITGLAGHSPGRLRRAASWAASVGILSA